MKKKISYEKTRKATNSKEIKKESSNIVSNLIDFAMKEADEVINGKDKKTP